MEALLTQLSQYGAVGIILALSIWYILNKDKQIKDLTLSQADIIKDMLDRANEEREKRNEAVTAMYNSMIVSHDANTRVLAELTELIKNRLPR